MLNAIQFRERDPACSAALLREATEQGVAASRRARISGGALLRSAARNLAALALVVAVALALNGMSPYGSGTLLLGLRRLAEPWNDDPSLRWPERTRIHLALEYDRPAPADGSPTKVAKGDTVKLVATEEGVLTSSVRLHARIEGSKTVDRPMSPDAAQEGRFSLVIPNILGNATFYATAGDGRSNTVEITAVDRPRVKDIRVAVTPPAYTGLPGEDPRGGGQIRALRGSTAKIVVEASKDVQECRAALQKAGRALTDITRLTRTRFVINLLVREDDLYVIQLTDMDGFEGARPEEYEIQGVVDQRPDIRILEPASDGAMLPDGALSFEFEAKDDYGTRDVFVHVIINNAAAPRYVLRLKGLEDSPRYFVQKSWAFDLSKVQPALNPGDHVTFQAFAHDGREDLADEIRSYVRAKLPDVSKEAAAHLAEAERIVEAQFQKLTGDPASTEQVVGADLRQRVKQLVDDLAAAKDPEQKAALASRLKALIRAESKSAREHGSSFTRLVDEEYAKLIHPDPKTPAALAAADMPPDLLRKIELKQVVGSGIGRSEILRMNLIDREELAAIVAEQQSALSVLVDNAADLQGRNAERTRKTAHDTAAKPDLEGYAAYVLDCQLTQENVESKIASAREKYADLVKTIVRNGLDTRAVKKRVQHISELFAHVADERFPGIRTSLQDAKLASPPDRSKRLEHSVSLQAQAVIEMRDIVAKLRGWSDMEKLIGRARKTVEMQDEAQKSTAALATEFTGRIAEELDNKGRERLALANSAQRGVRTETEMLEDDLAKVGESVKAAEVTMYLRVKRVLAYSRSQRLVEKMGQCEQLIAKNQCVAAGSIQTEVLGALKRIVQQLEDAVDPEKHQIAERGDGEVPMAKEQVFSELEMALEPLLDAQREVLRLTRELDADADRTTRLHRAKLDEAATKQGSITDKVLTARQAVLEAVSIDRPGEMLNNVVVIPIALNELADSMKTIRKRLLDDNTGKETQEMELDCITVIQNILAALRPESIVTEETHVAEPVMPGGSDARAVGNVEDVRLLQLMQVTVNLITVRIDQKREGEESVARLPELLQAQIRQLGDRQLLLAELADKVGALQKGPEDRPEIFVLPAPLMKEVGTKIRGGDTGKAVQKQQQQIVAILQSIIRQVLSAALAHSTLPDQLRQVAGGDAPESDLDVTKPAPDLTHLLPGLQGKKGIEEMLHEMQKLEQWAKFTATQLQQIRMGRRGQFGGKYGELVKRYYITLAGASGVAAETPKPDGEK